MNRGETTGEGQEPVLDKVLTAPNVITLLRLLLLPLFLWLLFGTPYHIAALVVYAIAASTDWVDGQVARRTHQVSKLGKLFDPFVDRLLIAVGVIAIFILGRLPLWILAYLIVRDIILLIGGRYLLAKVGKVPPVVYVGKFATAFIMFGFCLLLLGMPELPGLALPERPRGFPDSARIPPFWASGSSTRDSSARLRRSPSMSPRQFAFSKTHPERGERRACGAFAQDY